jgi:hypothetical protein
MKWQHFFMVNSGRKSKLIDSGNVFLIVPAVGGIGQYLEYNSKEFALSAVETRTKLQRSYLRDIPWHRNRFSRSV